MKVGLKDLAEPRVVGKEKKRAARLGEPTCNSRPEQCEIVRYNSMKYRPGSPTSSARMRLSQSRRVTCSSPCVTPRPARPLPVLRWPALLGPRLTGRLERLAGRDPGRDIRPASSPLTRHAGDTFSPNTPQSAGGSPRFLQQMTPSITALRTVFRLRWSHQSVEEVDYGGLLPPS